jgi:outer membrane protein assembly factor BamB
MNNILKTMKHICKLSFANCLLPIVFCFLPTVFLSCKEETVDFQTNDCKTLPAFIKKTGFNPARAALSTTENRKMGLILVEINENGDRKYYQDSSWKTAGWLGPILIDPQGNSFVGPVPVINLIDNPPAKQNIIYKIDRNTGKMNTFLELSVKENSSFANPYGILGFSYLCETNTLYASTVQGSTRQKENGILYAIDPNDGTILDKVENIDVMGMGISYISGKRRLYFGSARNSNIYSIVLNEKGTFSGKPMLECTIANLGPRGDDKARRIKFDKTTGNMLIYGLEFNFNLTAPTEKQENIYTFKFDNEENKWKTTLP